MRKHHPENERIKREYFNYLEQAKRMSQTSVDQIDRSRPTGRRKSLMRWWT